MEKDDDAKTLKILEDLIRKVVREELDRWAYVPVTEPWLPIELPWKISSTTW